MKSATGTPGSWDMGALYQNAHGPEHGRGAPGVARSRDAFSVDKAKASAAQLRYTREGGAVSFLAPNRTPVMVEIAPVHS